LSIEEAMVARFAGVARSGSLQLNMKMLVGYPQRKLTDASRLGTPAVLNDKTRLPANRTHTQRHRIMKQMLGLWRDTWWLWTAFLVLTAVFSLLVGSFFLLLLPCLPVPFVYFAFNRYDSDGNEKSDLGS